MNPQIQIHHPVIIWLRFAVRIGLFDVALLWSAGTWFWWEVWVTAVLWTVFGMVTTGYLLRNDPVLLAGRLELLSVSRDQKSWERESMILFLHRRFGADYRSRSRCGATRLERSVAVVGANRGICCPDTLPCRARLDCA
jgi:hypothetical protein